MEITFFMVIYFVVSERKIMPVKFKRNAKVSLYLSNRTIHEDVSPIPGHILSGEAIANSERPERTGFYQFQQTCSCSSVFLQLWQS